MMKNVIFIILCAFKGGLGILSQDLAIASTAPFMVSLLVRRDSPNTQAEDWNIVCGGVIVGLNSVLTTGSCVNSLQQSEIQKEDMLIRGNTGFWRCTCGRTMDHTISNFVVHPEFRQYERPNRPSVFENDVAVITVDNDFTGLYEKPKYFTTADMVNMYVVFGWGQFQDVSKRNEISASEQLRWGSLVIENKSKCNKIHEINLPEGTFCQQLYPSNLPCRYDTGGPLMGVIMFSRSLQKPFGMNLTYWDKIELGIIGLVSVVEGCQNIPPIYTNISGYVDWIQSNIPGISPDTW